MALADCALDLLYCRGSASDIGHRFSNEEDPELGTKDKEAHRLVNKAMEIKHGPTEVGTDNTGAFDLCHRTYPGKHTRHVDRRHFKMRELHHSGNVKLIHVPTEEMSADLLTKVLSDHLFIKHRDAIMNLMADYA